MSESNPPAKPSDLRRRLSVSGGQQKPFDVIAQEMFAALAAMTKSVELLKLPIIRMPPMPTPKILEKLQANWFTGVFPPLSFLDNLGPACSSATLETSQQVEEFRHSTDYASVIWRRHEYQFNKNQATCVRLLHEAWVEGTPYLSGHTLLSEIEGAVKMSGLYRRHPAWKRLIVPGERQMTYRLNLSPR